MAIRNVIYYILESMDKRNKCASIYCDLSKAFDCLRHDILILKLTYYGFEGTELNIMRTYLENREQIVCVNEMKSSKGHVNIGVPQGSILGPVLFLIYINDLVNVMPDWTYISLFADDTHVGIKDKCKERLVTKIEKAMTVLRNWFSANGIILNSDKSAVMHYTFRKGLVSETEQKENIFLGYTMDNTISHSAHIRKLCKSMASANYVIFKLRPLLDKASITSLYFSYIQSRLRYAVTVWGNAYDVIKVLRAQKRAIRTMIGLKKRVSVRQYFKNLKIMTVISLYIYNSILEIYEDKHQWTKVKSYQLRKPIIFAKPMNRLVKVQKQGIYTKIAMINKLPINIIELPAHIFKRKLKVFFEGNPFYSLNEFMSMRLTESSFS